MHHEFEHLRFLESLSRLLAVTPRGPAARALGDWLLRDRNAFGLDLSQALEEDEPGEPLDRLTKPENWARLRRAAARAAERAQGAEPDTLACNAEALADAAGLDAADARMLDTFARLSSNGPFSSMAEVALESGGLRAPEVAAALSGLSLEEARLRLRDGRYAAAGLLRPLRDRRPGHLGFEMLHPILQALSPPNEGRAAVERALLGPPQDALLARRDFQHLEPDAGFLQDLLLGAASSGARGVNILLYGPPGTGKSELARTLCAEAGLKLYSVGEADSESEEPSRWERLQALQLAQRLTASRQDAALLFEEMEDLFEEGGPVDWAGASYVKARSKVFFNRLLEDNATPIIWTTNAAGRFDPAILRRMTYAFELLTPPAPVRERMWASRLQQAGLTEPGAAARLAARLPAPAGLAANAVRAGALAKRGLDGVEHAAVGLAKALGVPRRSAENVEEFDPRLWNADIDIAALADQASRAADASRLSLLFYGPPGTGKSACARWLANRLGLEILLKRASDLLSKWVGETEQNIAAAFEEARRAKLFLIFDEADSFLHERAAGQQRWEVSEVNEMLTQMESHDQPFACTTNFASLVDTAALRRFTFKIKLEPLTVEQRRLAFADFFALEPPGELSRLDNLTPGDFAVVRRKLAFLPDAQGDAQAIAKLLASESAAKPDARKSLGFGS